MTIFQRLVKLHCLLLLLTVGIGCGPSGSQTQPKRVRSARSDATREGVAKGANSLDAAHGGPMQQRRHKRGKRGEAESDSAHVDGAFAEAEIPQRSALVEARREYPIAKFPNGHPRLAIALGELAAALQIKGDFRESRALFEESLAMQQRLGTAAVSRDAARYLAATYSNLGTALSVAGDYENALSHLDQAAAVFRRLYPKADDPELANLCYNTGRVLELQGKFNEACARYEESLKMRRRLFPRRDYPDGHRDIAVALSDLGAALALTGNTDSAVARSREAVEMYRRLFPLDAYPTGHPELAIALTNLSSARCAAGDYRGAASSATEALSLLEASYPPNTYPKGHPEIITALNNVGSSLIAAGDLSRGLCFLDRAAAMGNKLFTEGRDALPAAEFARIQANFGNACADAGDHAAALTHFVAANDLLEAAYPNDDYPDGHLGKITNFLNVGILCMSSGDIDEATHFLKGATVLLIRYCKANKFPAGRQELALASTNLGIAAKRQGDSLARESPDLALKYYEQAMELCEFAQSEYEALYTEDKFPNGHPRQAELLLVEAGLFERLGESEEAGQQYDMAVELLESLYPQDDYPMGHPTLARAYISAGESLYLRRREKRGLDLVRRGVTMQHDLAAATFSAMSEAEALAYASTLPVDVHTLISLARDTRLAPDLFYETIWKSRAVISQLLSARARSARIAPDGPTAAVAARLRAVRGELSRLSPGANASNSEVISALTAQKESLEHELALKAVAENTGREQRSYAQLAIALPARSAFVQISRYILWDEGGEQARRGLADARVAYCAFLVARDGDVTFVDLAPADQIDMAVEAWRGAIASGASSQRGGELRRLIWEPIEQSLPAGTDTVYLTPDGPLALIPWGALPGKSPDTVLLEQYSFAVVPYGPFLLERLTNAPRPLSGDDALLAVGSVSYDGQPVPPPNRDLAVRDAVGPKQRRLHWPDLPGTRDEINALRSFAADRRTTVLLSRDASTTRSLDELPKARWAVFATHGFFADAALRSVLQADANSVDRNEPMPDSQRTSPIGRNPLLLSGLVFAGANLPRAMDELGVPLGDGGILTAEAIASMPLENLELVVLSACDTGLGEVAGGEGVFGLQRAFHQAGAANVVASLWKIDDSATAALMRLFYYKVFRENKPALAALREAQLTIYHHPEQIGALASARAPDFGQAVKLADGDETAARTGRAATRLWAGFTLSGAGR